MSARDLSSTLPSSLSLSVLSSVSVSRDCSCPAASDSCTLAAKASIGIMFPSCGHRAPPLFESVSGVGVRKSLSRSFDLPLSCSSRCKLSTVSCSVGDNGGHGSSTGPALGPTSAITFIPIQALFLTRRLNNLYRHELCILQGNGTVGKPCNFSEPKLPELPGLKRCQSCQGSKDEPIGAIKKWQHGAKTQSGGKPS